VNVEARLTIVFAALAVTRLIENRAAWPAKRARL